MSVNKTPKRTSASIVLEAGEDPTTGKALTKNVPIGGLRGDPDLEKILNVVTLAAPCLAFPVERTELTEVSVLESE